MKKKMVKFISCYGKYLILFVFFFLCLQFFYTDFYGDQIYNFGFSYAVSRGEIPYRDFNIIVPSFGAYFYAIAFLLFNTNLIIFNLFQAFLLCILFFFLFQLYGKKASFLLIVLCIPVGVAFASIMYQGYNFLLLLELVILLYLEKNHKSDYIIGFIVGICFLTKQTVGFCLLLPSLYYLFKKREKFVKRILGFFIPCVIFLIFLLVTGTVQAFFDLCFLGMFDFTKSNGRIMDYNSILFLIGIIFVISRIIKDRTRMDYYYILAFSSIAIPLFDYYHVALFVFSCTFLLLDYISVTYHTLFLHSFILAVVLVLTWVGFSRNFQFYLSKFHHFEYQVITKQGEESIQEINQYIKQNRHTKIIILSANSYYLKICNDMDITYYDLLNYGNHGYHGTWKMIQRLKDEEDALVIINRKEYQIHNRDRQQLNKEVLEYAMDRFPLIKKIGNYNIYRVSID